MLHLSRAMAALLILLGLIYRPAQAQTPAPPPVGSSRWPVVVNSDQGTVTIFQPQLENFQGDQLSGRAAVSVQMPGQPEPVFGCVWITSRVAIDRVARTVQIVDVNITRTRFPDATGNTQVLADAVYQVFAGRTTSLSLDQLLSMLEVVHKEEAAATQLVMDTPTIVFLDHPAVKVQYDGTPKLVQVDNSKLFKVVNTPFFVTLDPDTKAYYLKGAGHWFVASEPMGPFLPAHDVPAAVSALADSSGYQDPQPPSPSAATPTAAAADVSAVQIVTATDPTELVWTDGPAEMAAIPGTDLMYVTNTDSDIFVLVDTQQIYLLLSGRWYTAPTHDGPWTYVPPAQLPPDFARIPADSDKVNVLADVPGTQAAEDAVADTFLPQTAAVDLHKFDQPPVEYDGSPDFVPIPGTNLMYALNTDACVVMAHGRYYCCYNAVWYVSDTPTGPWMIATSIPAEIYTIPPSCPIYPCRFVSVYGFTPDVCYVGYLPGYAGCYAYNGVVVYGTGYRYRPWLGRHYYPRPCTFGFAARYNWYSGHWGFDFALAFGGGRGWIGKAPARWVRNGGVWFGYGGFRPVYAHDAAHATAAQRELAIDAARRDAYVRSVYDHRTDVRREPGLKEIDRVPLRPAGAAPRNDVFADPQGNVYRKTLDGWQQREQNQWHSAPPERRDPTPRQPPVREPPAREPPVRPEPARPAPNYGSLNGDYRARVSGEQRPVEDRPAMPVREPERAAPPPEAPRYEAPRSEPPHEEPPHAEPGGRR